MHARRVDGKTGLQLPQVGDCKAGHDYFYPDLINRYFSETARHDRGVDRIPRQWVEHMKDCVDCLCHFVNTHRMVRDYVQSYYVNAHKQFRALEVNNAHRARDLSAWVQRIRREWKDVWIVSVEDGPANTIPVASAMRVRAQVYLGGLNPQDVLVELWARRCPRRAV